MNVVQRGPNCECMRNLENTQDFLRVNHCNPTGRDCSGPGCVCARHASLLSNIDHFRRKRTRKPPIRASERVSGSNLLPPYHCTSQCHVSEDDEEASLKVRENKLLGNRCRGVSESESLAIMKRSSGPETMIVVLKN